jgi:pimeloyl-ACP methyl ester carboxylesterase
MTTAAARNGLIAFERSGEGEPGFVLLHGWCCDRDSMRPLATHLATRGSVANMDLPGHGESGIAGPFTSADVVGEIFGVADQCGMEQPILIGHSIGAKFVLLCAVMRPERVSKVILLDTSIDETPERRIARLREVEDPAFAGDKRQRLEAMFVGSSSEHRDIVVETMLQVPSDVAAAALRAGDQIDVAEALSASSVPVLYIGASRPMARADRLLELRPDAWYGQVVGSSHFVQLDAPEQVNAMIDRFVAHGQAR